MKGRRATLARTWRKRLPLSAAQRFHEPHFGLQTRSTAAWIFAASGFLRLDQVVAHQAGVLRTSRVDRHGRVGSWQVGQSFGQHRT
jgi:hypothetical protein